MGADAAQADEQEGGRRSRAWVAGTALQSQACGQDSEAGASRPQAAGLARFWVHVRRRAVGQATPDPGWQRDLAQVDDRGRAVEEQVAATAKGALLATAAERLWRSEEHTSELQLPR